MDEALANCWKSWKSLLKRLNTLSSTCGNRLPQIYYLPIILCIHSPLLELSSYLGDCIAGANSIDLTPFCILPPLIRYPPITYWDLTTLFCSCEWCNHYICREYFVSFPRMRKFCRSYIHANNRHTFIPFHMSWLMQILGTWTNKSSFIETIESFQGDPGAHVDILLTRWCLTTSCC